MISGIIAMLKKMNVFQQYIPEIVANVEEDPCDSSLH